MKNIFDNYLDNVNSILSNPVDNFNRNYVNENLSKGYSSITGIHNNSTPQKTLAEFNHSDMAEIFGVNKFSIKEPVIGSHPDFQDMGENEHRYHYAVSMFMDIKGSTKLSTKYSLTQVRLIKDTILTLAIHVCNFFGGHIQRLQGDGMFVYFVRKDQHPNDAIISAINSASILSMFINYNLNNILEQFAMNKMKVRIGIDYGKDEDVLWSYYGVRYCNELTTTSLHTDLAAKLQSQADNTGIMLGDNIVNTLGLTEKYVSVPINNGVKDYYIFNFNGKTYRKWDFNWDRYLKTYDFIKSDHKQLIFSPAMLRLTCEISPIGKEEWITYPPNLFSIPKNYNIRFKITTTSNSHYQKAEFEQIRWEVKNTGKEATDANMLSHNMGGNYDNTTIASTTSAYLGHHSMNVRLIRQNIDDIKITFPLFVRPD